MPVSDMCKAMVELSDNTCANLLLARSGGPAALTAFRRATGDVVACTQGGPPTPQRFEAVFAEIGRMMGPRLGQVSRPR
jgi:beta-lactamase class A